MKDFEECYQWRKLLFKQRLDKKKICIDEHGQETTVSQLIKMFDLLYDSWSLQEYQPEYVIKQLNIIIKLVESA